MHAGLVSTVAGPVDQDQAFDTNSYCSTKFEENDDKKASVVLVLSRHKENFDMGLDNSPSTLCGAARRAAAIVQNLACPKSLYLLLPVAICYTKRK